MSLEDLEERHIRNKAHDHFQENGDKVRWKAGMHPHSSYNVLRGILTRYAYSRVGRDWQNAEDAVQDAYVKTLETAKYNEFFNFGGLYKIWLDRSIRDIRRTTRKNYNVIVEDEVIDQEDGLTLVDLAESDDANVELLFDVQNKVNEMMEQTNTFKPKAKAIIRLILLFGYSQKEVAEMLDVNVISIKNTLHYFRRVYSES